MSFRLKQSVQKPDTTTLVVQDSHNPRTFLLVKKDDQLVFDDSTNQWTYGPIKNPQPIIQNIETDVWEPKSESPTSIVGKSKPEFQGMKKKTIQVKGHMI